MSRSRSDLFPVSPPVSSDGGAGRPSALFVASLHAFHTRHTPHNHHNIDASDEEDDDPFTLDEQASEANEAGPASFKLYPQRWLMLAIFSAFSASSGMEWLTYAPISPLFTLYFASSPFTVTCFSLLFMLVYVCLAIPVGGLVRSHGARDSLCAAATVNLIGATLKLLPWPFVSGFDYPNVAWGFALSGSMCCAIAQLVVLPTPVLLASSWFGSHERVTATAIGTAANSIGYAIAFVLVPLTLGSHSSEVVQDPLQARELPVYRLLLMHLLLVAGATWLVIKHFVARPPTPPSFTAAIERGEAQTLPPPTPNQTRDYQRNEKNPLIDVKQAIAQGAAAAADTHASARQSDGARSDSSDSSAWFRLLTSALDDRAFQLVCLSFSLLCGIGWAVLLLLSPLLTAACSYSPTLVSGAGAVAILTGACANALVGHVADTPRGRRHKKIIVWAAFATATAAMMLFTIIPILEQNK